MSQYWLRCFLIVLFVIGKIVCQKTIEHIINDGESQKLYCKFENNYDYVMWNFKNEEGETKQIYNSRENKTNNLKVDCSKERKICDLELQNVMRENAGDYDCAAKTDKGVDETLVNYKLVVGRLNCGSTAKESVIAKNDCQEVEATSMTLTCEMDHKGPAIEIPLRWRTTQRNDELKSHVAGNKIEHSTEVTVDMKDQIFECSVKGHPKVRLCNTNIAKIFYVKNITQNMPPMNLDDVRPVTCKANMSDSGVSCSYVWTYLLQGSQTQVDGEHLSTSHMKEPGTYTCIATCKVGGYENCKILAERFDLVVVANSKAVIVGPIVAGGFVLVVLVGAAIFCYTRRKSRAAKKKSGDKGKKDGKVPLSTIEAGQQQLMPSSASTTDKQSATPVPPQIQSSTAPLLPNQSRNGGGGVASTGRKASFKRGHSVKGSQEFQTIKEEGGDSPGIVGDQPSQIGQKIILNDAKGPVMGLCHMNERIYCVAKNSNKLFAFCDSPPFNRLIPEEVTLNGLTTPLGLTDPRGLTNPQALVACHRSGSVYVSDYNEYNLVYRIFPRKEDNKICRGKVDGSPACIALVESKPDTIVAILKSCKKMQIEVYDSSRSVDGQGSVKEWETWEKKYIIIITNKDVTLPLFVCVSNEEVGAPSSKLYLLYGSGKLSSSGEFDFYKICQIDPETSRVHTTCNLKDFSPNVSDKFIPTSMVSDNSRGGVLVLEKKWGQLVHLDSDLTKSCIEVKTGVPQNRLCFRSRERKVIFGGSSSKPFLTCYQLKDPPVPC